MAKTHIMVKFVQQRKDMRAVMKNMALPNSGLKAHTVNAPLPAYY